MRPTLFIVAKAPMMGKAKTRLAADIGPVHAKRIYRSLMAQVLRQVGIRVGIQFWLSPRRICWGMFRIGRALIKSRKSPDRLSPRLAALFARKGPTLTIGTDCPQVTSTDIAAAFQALRSKSYVFGPASDGGFWLMGTNGPLPRGFLDDVRWSHAKTLKDVKAETGGNYAELRTLTDVDDLKALRLLRKSAL